MINDVKPHLVPRELAASVHDLVQGATGRERFSTAETRSGSRFEQVWIDRGRGAEPFVMKLLELDRDFAMRASGDIGCRPVTAFAAGLMDVADDVIDHAVVGAARHLGRNGWGGALLMRDVTRDLVPPGDDPIPADQHLAFLDHLARLCARTWGWTDHDTGPGLLPYESRWQFFGPAVIEVERTLGWPEPVPRIAAEGWRRFHAAVDRDLSDTITQLGRDVLPLADALRATPSCLLHGDWKMSNLGTAGDGRTVLVDWAYVGLGPACHEIGWYLALNRRRLPAGHTKERVLDDFRRRLEEHAIATSGWWDRQLHLALLGTVVQFGWEKALGDDAELRWWCDRARAGAALL